MSKKGSYGWTVNNFYERLLLTILLDIVLFTSYLNYVVDRFYALCDS